MFEESDKPEGCVIERREDMRGTTYRWPTLKRGGLLILSVVLSIWLIPWGAGEWFALKQVRAAAPFSADWLASLGMLGFWTIGGVFVFLLIIASIKGPPYESVQLAESQLVFTRGVTKKETKNSPFAFLHRRPRVEMVADDLTPIEVKRGSKRDRLILVHGESKTEIGRSLRNEDRNWLADILRAWHRRSSGVATTPLLDDQPVDDVHAAGPEAVEIKRHEGRGQIVYQWKADDDRVRWLFAFVQVCIVLFLTGCIIAFMSGIMQPTQSTMMVVIISGVLLLLAGFILVTAGRALTSICMSSRERVVLTDTALVFELPRDLDEEDPLGFLRRVRRFERTKDELEISVRQRGKQKHLFLEAPPTRFEIGRTLCESDRLWLANTIKAWRSDRSTST